MKIMMEILIGILMGILMDILMGFLMIDSMGWPYYSSNCLLYIANATKIYYKKVNEKVTSTYLYVLAKVDAS